MLGKMGVCAAAIALTTWGFVLTSGAQEIRQPSQTGAKPEVAWQNDLRKAHKISVREGRPLLLVFGADWCTFCKKLEHETLGHPELAAYVNASFVPVHLDYDKDERAREILEVEKLPCTVILSPDADLLDRFEGYRKPAGYYRKLAAAKELHARMTRQTSGRKAP